MPASRYSHKHPQSFLARIRHILRPASHQPAVRKLAIPAVYACISLLILGPLLHPGFILTLDMVFTPQLRIPTVVSNSYLWYAALHWLNAAIPADWLQKIMLLAIFWMAGWGMHRLVTSEMPHTNRAAAFAGGLLYMANPFVYERFITGQYAVIGGYAILPWFVRSLLYGLRQPGWKQELGIAGWALTLSVVSIHSIVPGLLVSMTILVWQLRRQQGSALRHRLAMLGGAVGIWLVASSYWLLPALGGRGHLAQIVGSFAGGDRSAFATLGGSFIGRLANVLCLQGFWAESRGLFISPPAKTPGWLVLMVSILLLVCGGLIVLWRQRYRGLFALALGCIVSGGLLAAGLGNSWLSAHLPLFAGYREPQKFVMLVAFGYAIALVAGLSATGHWLARHRRLPVTMPLFWLAVYTLIVLSASPLWWGTRGQLQASHYPRSWDQANQLLNRDPDAHFSSVFVPWHLYLYSDFAGRIIANPASAYFDRPVIISDNPELGSVARSPGDYRIQAIDRALANGPSSNQQLGKDLAKLHVKYILVARVSSDALRYGYLDRQSNITPVAKYDTLWVYKNDAYTATPAPPDTSATP